MTAPAPQRFSVAVFAHNEERNIHACLDSLMRAIGEHTATVHVLANGCTDATASMVARYAVGHDNVRLHRIDLGDKANAWNAYVHDLASPADCHVFVDGDVSVEPDSLEALYQALDKAPHANAAAAIPATGRNRATLTDEILTARGLSGNLYALSGAFVARVRETEIRIPTGLIGEDSFVGALAAFDLDPARGWNPERIVPCANARFRFRSLSPYRLRDWKIYLRRRVRYALREIQFAAVRKIVHQHGFHALPPDARDLYPHVSSDPELRPVLTRSIFHRLAARRLTTWLDTPAVSTRAR